MTDIVIEVQAKSLLGALKGLGNALRSQRRFLRSRAYAYIRERTQQSFDWEQEPAGVPWAFLNDKYLRRKLREGYSTDILKRGKKEEPSYYNLFLSLTQRGHRDQVFEVAGTQDNATLTYGTRATTESGANKGWIHQGERRARGVPQRVILDITEQQANEIRDMDVNFIQLAMARNGA